MSATAGLEILNLHAQGGMAEVYRARAVDEHGRVWYYAVKRMLPELLKEPEMMRMFLEEQRVAACLVHPNIVRVYDVAQADTADTFIVMEFLEGRDLSEVIESAAARKRTLPIWFCIHVCREVLKALHYATTQATDKSGRILGLIHRDISPHNIFVCRDGQVKLTDFGVAKVETAEVRTKAGIIKGKFGYMSPEQLSAQQLDLRSDLYNVGILLYESLTTKRLFFGETATQFIAAMMMNEVPPLDKKLLVPPELEQLMRRALSRKRDERPQNALAFEQALGALAQRYHLVADPAHVAAELAALFPELLVAPATDELPRPSPTPVPEAHPRTQPRALTMMSVAPEELISSSSREAQAGVENEEQEPTVLTDMPKPRPVPAPVTGARPADHRPQSAPPPQLDDELVPTLLEPRPTFDELGLEPADLLAPADDVEAMRTEPTRLPAFIADPPSTTAPGRRGAPADLGLRREPAADDEEDEGYDADAPTTEVSRPSASLFAEAPPPPRQPPPPPTPPKPAPAPVATPSRPHRVSTGSRRVISLTDEEDDRKKR